MKSTQNQKSIFTFFEEKFNFKVQALNFRFPIETLEKLLKQFYKEYDQSAFLVQSNKNIQNLFLKKMSKSYLLSVPIPYQSNEHLYVGLSDLLSFLILFGEPNAEEQNIKEQQSRFFLTFDPSVITEIFNYFYPKENFSINEMLDVLKKKPEILEYNKKSVINAGYQKSLEQDKIVSSKK